MTKNENKPSKDEIKKLKQDSERLQALLQITEVGLSSLSLEELLQKLIERMVKITKADAGMIWIIDPGRQTLIPKASKNIDDKYMPFFEMKVGQYLAGTIAEKQIPMTLKDLPIPKRAKFYIKEQKIKSMLGVPLKNREGAIGVARLDYKNERDFIDIDVELFQVLADRATRAIENANLYKQQQEIASSLQKNLIPEAPPITDLDIGIVYKSATKAAFVGGDFYDFALDENELFILIGDVSGKGVETAIDAAIVKYAFRLLHTQKLPLDNLVFQLNNFLRQQLPPGKFITAIFAKLNLKTNDLCLLNAGHPLPLIFNSEKKIGYFLKEQNNTAMGIFKDEKYSTQLINLQKNDTVALYTDGLIEARKNGVMFGEDRLYNSVSIFSKGNAQSQADNLVQKIQKYSNGVLTDDVAMIIVKI